MTRIVLKNPTPPEERYTIDQIHALVCRHEKQWRKLPELATMMHERRKDGYHSRVTGLAWFYYCGQDSMEHITKQFKVSEAAVHALAHVLGIQRLAARYRWR